MKLKVISAAVVFVVLFALSAVGVKAQTPDAIAIWIRVHGAAGAVANMSFGNRVGNTTSGQDTGATFPAEYREQEAPPETPGFNSTWGAVRVNQFGGGSLLDRQFNFWAAPVYNAQRDTFKINFNQKDDPFLDITFKWMDAAGIASRCDSLVMIYLDPNLGTNVRLNMSTTDTLVIPQAGNNSVSSLRIIKYGGFPVDLGVKENPTGGVPKTFQLYQNYPNPFNPTTTIKLDIASPSTAEIAVYNLLGQKVKTLFSGELSATQWVTEWNGTTDNGTPVTSGVYFVRLSARTKDNGESFTALRKLLLMK